MYLFLLNCNQNPFPAVKVHDKNCSFDHFSWKKNKKKVQSTSLDLHRNTRYFVQITQWLKISGVRIIFKLSLILCTGGSVRIRLVHMCSLNFLWNVDTDFILWVFKGFMLTRCFKQYVYIIIKKQMR